MRPVSVMGVCCFFSLCVLVSLEESPSYDEGIIEYILRGMPRDNYDSPVDQGSIHRHHVSEASRKHNEGNEPETKKDVFDELKTKGGVYKRDRRLQCILRDAWGRCRRYRKLGLWGKREN